MNFEETYKLNINHVNYKLCGNQSLYEDGLRDCLQNIPDNL